MSGILTLGALDSWVFAMMIGGVVAVVLVGIITDAITKVTRTRTREESRREIAAYVAEGSISADEGAKLLSAGESIKDKLGVKS
ncbi:MAG: hypothetical protein KF745_12655 [Phycisphaeraceae bacterium]|nr:hypothetical protein [Phycisphaeraceae bacterium]